MDDCGMAVCVDCAHVVPIMFFLAAKQGYLVGFAKCDRCAFRGDKRSLHIKLTLPRRVFDQAVIDGLEVVTIKEAA